MGIYYTGIPIFQETAGRPEPPDQPGGGEETESEGREENQAPPPDPVGDREEATFGILLMV